MNRYLTYGIFCLLLPAVVLFLPGCKGDDDKPIQKSDSWDIDQKAPPKFITHNYIEIEKIYRISKFRSAIGHDYSDFMEPCRSMKHYFEPFANLDWTAVKIYAPMTGVITRIEQEWSGTKIELASEDYPAFRVSIFHITPSFDMKVDDKITAGTLLGNQVGNQTYSDVSVVVNDPTRQGRMVSYFAVISDEVFAAYQALGVNSRGDLIITKEERDAHPITCNGDVFNGSNGIEDWVYLVH